MAQVSIPLPSNPLKAVDGYKTYIVLACGVLTLVLNHFGWLPAGTIPNNPTNWLNDIFTLMLVGTGRSALKK